MYTDDFDLIQVVFLLTFTRMNSRIGLLLGSVVEAFYNIDERSVKFIKWIIEAFELIKHINNFDYYFILFVTSLN